MAKQTVKTTIELDANLLYQAKLTALREGKTLKHIIHASLKKHLKSSTPLPKTRQERIGGPKLGGVKGTLSRSEIYEDV